MPHATSTERNYDEFIVERDMVGYGMKPPNVEWPGGAKIAVSFVVEFKEGAERSLEHGDETSDNTFMDLGAYLTREARDDMQESEFEYGPRAGLPRILKLFERYDLSATVNVTTAALERNPYWQKHLLANPKLELVCSSKRDFDYFAMAPQEEEKHIAEAIEFMEKTTGKVPEGWYVGRRSNTSQRLYTRLCKEKGVAVYSSDSFSDELPYWTTSPLTADGYPDEGLLQIPYQHDTSDWRFNNTAVGWSSGKDWLQHLKDSFDILYEEGSEGEAKMMSVGIHPRISGRAGRTAFLEEFIKYIKEKEGVWIPKRGEIASFWREAHPYDPATAAQLEVKKE
ncbi:hypothetical protein JCM8547_000306 [Rhodosporidiobolus lusitaniae]